MASVEDKIREFEEELRTTKVNKATMHHIGLVKAKIARLKQDQEVLDKKSGGGGLSYSIRKSGDATALLVGFPSVGKSTLLNQFTNADSKVAAYEFTTLEVIPGLLEYKGAKIQLLDVPGIVEGAATGKGRGREVLSVVRNADLIIMLIDPKKPDQITAIQNELYTANIRMNSKPPSVLLKKKAFGGINITAGIKLTLEEQFIKDILMEYGVHNCDIVFRQDVTVDELIDAITGNRMYVPSIVVLNKLDKFSKADLAKIKKSLKPDIFISAEKDTNLSELRELIFNKLQLIRIYMKKLGEDPDMKEPLILSKDHSVKGVCKKIHKDFVKRFKYAKVWGRGAKFPGQTVGFSHKLKDEDILELHLER